MKKKLLIFLFISLLAVIFCATASAGTELENSGSTWTLYIDVAGTPVENGTYAFDSPIQIRIPWDEWNAGGGKSAGDPEWTVKQTGGSVTYSFTAEKEEWDDGRGIQLKRSGTAWPGTGDADYSVSCKWNGVTYEGTFKVLFKKLGTAPSGITLSVAPYDKTTGTAGTAAKVTNNTIEMESGKYYLVSADYTDNKPVCDDGHWLNTGNENCFSLVDPRPQTSTQLILYATKSGSCNTTFSLTPGMTNLQTNGRVKIIVDGVDDSGNDPGPTDPTKPTLENSGLTWTAYVDLSDQFVENGSYTWDFLPQLRVPQQAWQAGGGKSAGDPVWTVTQTGGSVTYSFTAEKEEWNDGQGIQLKKSGTAWPGTGDANYSVSCQWNGVTYEGTAKVLFKNLGTAPSGIILSVAPYDKATGNAGTAVKVTGNAFEMTEGEYYLVSAEYADNEPACDYGHWLNTGNEDCFSLVDPRPQTSTQLILHATNIGSSEASFNLTPGQTNMQTNGRYTISVVCKTHTEEAVAGKAATCTEDGLTAGVKCSVCGKMLTEQQTIPATGHTAVKDDAVAATCSATGLTEGSHCSVCGEVLTAQTETAKLPHTEVKDAGKAATCTEAGMTDGKHCSVCGEVIEKQTEIAALGHDWDDGKITKEATYSEDGVKTFTCKRCGETKEETVSIRPYTGKTGWVHNADDSWCYGDPDGYAVTGPQKIDGVMYCFDEKGKMITGWGQAGGKWYYADASGALVRSAWEKVGGDWYYFRANGEMATGWVNDGGDWYYMKDSGRMATGWLKDGGDWYYMKDSGRMATGWVEDGNDWYYFRDNGVMLTGWVQSGGNWYYMKSGGAMATGWLKDGGAWYYFKSNGAMVTGWQRIGGKWYCFRSSGAMITGWFEDKEAEKQLPAGAKQELWYWFDESGVMATGWKEIKGQWEMFAENGLWLYTWDGN